MTEIVIRISQEDYEAIKDGSIVGDMTIPYVFEAIRNGTPLPKGHGDLIDRRDLKKEVYTTTEWNGDIHRIIYEASIDNAKPIIEADKGVLEKINEKQDSLKATCKAWDEAIQKNGYVN